MKKLVLAAAIAAMGMNTAQAAIEDFAGFSAGVMMGFQANTMKLQGSYENTEDFDYSNSYVIDGSGRQGFIGQLTGEYGIVISPAMLLSLGATVDLNKNTIFKENEEERDDGDVYSYSAKAELKNAYSLFVAPGYLITEKTIAYAKLSYVAGKVRTSDTEDFLNVNKSVNGFGLAFGSRTLLNEHLSLIVEAGIQDYGSFSHEIYDTHLKASVKTTQAKVGLSYKF